MTTKPATKVYHYLSLTAPSIEQSQSGLGVVFPNSVKVRNSASQHKSISNAMADLEFLFLGPGLGVGAAVFCLVLDLTERENPVVALVFCSPSE